MISSFLPHRLLDPITVLPFEKQQLLLEKVIADTYTEDENKGNIKGNSILDVV